MYDNKFLAHYLTFVVPLCLYPFIFFILSYVFKAFDAPSVTFQEHFFNSFWPCVGVGIVLTFLTFGFIKLQGKL